MESPEVRELGPEGRVETEEDRRLPFGSPGQDGVVLEILRFHVLLVPFGVLDRPEDMGERVAGEGGKVPFKSRTLR